MHPKYFLFPAAVAAMPTSPLEAALENAFCLLNAAVISALKQGAAATSYCSSYLSIPTVTSTVTATSTPSPNTVTVVTTGTADAITTTVTVTDATPIDITVTQTATASATTTITSTTSTSTITCLNSAYTATQPTGVLAKRGGSAGKPTCIPNNWESAAISSACKCLSIATPTVTVTTTQTLSPATVTTTSTTILTPVSSVTDTYTPTSTAVATTTTTSTTTLTAYAVATTIASNGVTYRKYTHDYDANSDDSGFDSSYFKDLDVDFSGTLQSLSFSTPNWPSGSVYLTLADRSSSFDAEQAAILLQGFFIAQETGTYTLSSSSSYIDNWGYLWTGDVAYSEWDDDNTDFQASRTGAGYYGGSFSVTMNEGDAIPLTWLWANGGGVSQSYFGITTPDGDFTTDTTGYFVQACSSSVFA